MELDNNLQWPLLEFEEKWKPLVSLSNSNLQQRIAALSELDLKAIKGGGSGATRLTKQYFHALQGILDCPHFPSLRQSAAQALVRNFSLIPFSIFEAACFTSYCFRILQHDPDPIVRNLTLQLCKFVSDLKFGNSLRWSETSFALSSVLPKLKGISFQEQTFDILLALQGKGSKMAMKDVAFIVYSWVANNDSYRANRLLALDLIGTLNVVNWSLLLQGCRKDSLHPQESSKKLKNPQTKKKKPKVARDANETFDEIPVSFSIPLLCCGVFAHGIEDQFARVRLAALSSLSSCIDDCRLDKKLFENGNEFFSFFLKVLLDAILDDNDLIRLSALKIISSFPYIEAAVEGGLDILLALFDDCNREIRMEALKIVSQTLHLPASTPHEAPDMKEALHRTQLCLDLAIRKFSDMEGPAILAINQLVLRWKTQILQNTECLASLLQTSDPKFLLPTTPLHRLSPLHQITQSLILPEYRRMNRTLLVKHLSRCADFEALWSEMNSQPQELIFPTSSSIRNDTIANHSPSSTEANSFLAIISNHRSRLESPAYRYQSDCLLPEDDGPQSESYFFSPEPKQEDSALFPSAHILIRKVLATPNPAKMPIPFPSDYAGFKKIHLKIEDYRTIGNVEDVKLAASVNDGTLLVPFSRKGDKFVASFLIASLLVKDEKDIKIEIINNSNSHEGINLLKEPIIYYFA